MDSSVIVITHNEGWSLERTVNGLMAAADDQTEIIVVDDCSTDGSADFIDATYCGVRLVRSQERLGVSRARNRGASEARGRYLIFCDAHVDVSFGWIEGLLPELDKPAVGAVMPAVAAIGDPAARGFGLSLNDLSLAAHWLGWQAAEPYPVPMVCGCFMAMRRDVFDAVGRFDDGLVGWGADDSEMSLRLWLLGYECIVVPQVEVGHLFRSPFPYHVDGALTLHNNLRLAVLHFGSALLERTFARVVNDQFFPAALARVMTGDVLDRRRLLEAKRQRDAEWYFDRFAIPVN